MQLCSVKGGYDITAKTVFLTYKRLQIYFDDGKESSTIELSLFNQRNIALPQISIHVKLLRWQSDHSNDDEISFGLKEAEIVVLNDIGEIQISTSQWICSTAQLVQCLSVALAL